MAKKKSEKVSLEDKLKDAFIPEDEQPYEIPDNWMWVKLGDISKVISKGTTPKQYADKGIKFLRVENIENNYKFNFLNVKFIDENTHTNFLKRSILKEYDVLISIAGTLGKTAVVNKSDLPLNTNQAISFVRLINPNEIFSNFISLLFNSYSIRAHLLSKTKTTSIPNLTLEIIGNSFIPFPPLKEQERIVNKIDSMFSKIDEAKNLIAEARENFQLRKSALLDRAFKGELTKELRAKNKCESAEKLLEKINEEKLKNWEKACKEAEKNKTKKPAKPTLKSVDEMIVTEEIPYDLPKGWVWVKLGDVTKVYSGGTPSTSNKNFYNNGTIAWITPKDLSGFNEKYISQGNKFITKLGLEKSSATLMPKNTVIMSSRAPIGYVAIASNELSTNQGFKNFAPTLAFIPDFLYYYIKKSKNYLESIATGTTFKELSGEKASKILFPLGPLEEQKEIVRILDSILSKEEEALNAVDIDEDIELIKKSILDKAFRGQLGTHDDKDEPAIELLKRVLEEKE